MLRTIDAGIDPYDVEDLARARDGTFWLADIGDNGLNRSTIAVERLRPDGSATLFRLTYPDGPHDAEALLLTPSGQLFIATKEPLRLERLHADRPAVRDPADAAAQGRVDRVPADRDRGRAGRRGRAGGGDRRGGLAGRADGGAADVHRRVRVVGAGRGRGGGDLVGPAAADPAPADRSGRGGHVHPGRPVAADQHEGVPAPVQVIPLGDAAPTPTRAADAPTAAGPAEPDSESGDLLRTLAAPLVVVVAMGAVISYAVTRRR